MAVKEQMLKAKALINEKRYDEARKILEKVDHPTAREWLTKLDAIAPKGTAPARAKPGMQKQSTTPTRGGRRSILPLLIAGIIVLLGVLVGVLFVLPRLNSPSNTTSQALTQRSEENAPTEAVGSAATEESLSNADNSAGSSPEGSGDSANVTGSGLRVPFAVSNGLLTVELPTDWVCDCAGSIGQLHPAANVRGVVRADLAARAFDPAYYVDKTLTDALNEELDDDETLTRQETLTAGSREVLAATITDEDGDMESRYYVKDSDGHIVRMTIPSYVDDHSSLRPAVLLMLSTVEGETGDAALTLTTRLLEGAVAYNTTLNRWRVADTLDSGIDHYLELPANWVIGRGGLLGLPMAMRSDTATATDTAIVFVPSGFHASSDTVMDILISFSGGDQVVTQETLQAGGREVAFAVLSQAGDPSSASAYYLTRDSDGDVVALIVQPNVADQAALHEDLLFIIGNIEAEAVDYVTKLRRIGVLPADEQTNDGYDLVLSDQ